MIGLGTAFWLMVAFFALIGTLRGWTREIVATSGLVLSLFALNQFGFFLISLLGAAAEAGAGGVDIDSVRRQQFFILSTVHLLIAFFSYQGPAFAGRAVRERLRVRDSLQDKVLGALVGAVNGYLIVGTIWTFLEYQVGPAGYTQLPLGIPYPFDPMSVARPILESPALALMEKLPLPLLAPYLPFLVVVVFLFVIVVMI